MADEPRSEYARAMTSGVPTRTGDQRLSHAVSMTIGSLALVALTACGCPTYGGLRGRLIDQNGKPIAGARVNGNVGGRRTPPDLGTAITDATGSFELPASDVHLGGSEACVGPVYDFQKSGCESEARQNANNEFVLQCR